MPPNNGLELTKPAQAMELRSSTQWLARHGPGLLLPHDGRTRVDAPRCPVTLGRCRGIAGRRGLVRARPGGFFGLAIKSPLHYSSLADVAKLIAARELQSIDLTQQLLDRIAAVDGRLQSYVTVMTDRAIASARRADAEIRAGRYRGPLHGVPIAVKDLCNTRGVRTMAGTKVLADFVPDFDATVVARLEAAGAVILGKLVLCEGAFGPYFPGLQVPVNPWDATRWSGVSSSGSGVATAAGLCFASVGTDTGGSIRYPSAANGCVGLKPTYGRVSRYGVFALAASMDHVGPMTRTVEDAAIMFEAMAGPDPHDPRRCRTGYPRYVPNWVEDCGPARRFRPSLCHRQCGPRCRHGDG